MRVARRLAVGLSVLATAVAVGAALTVEHPKRHETLQYDAAGRLLSRQVQVVSQAGTRIEHELRYRYDTRGLLVAASLPDGSELRYVRDGQGQVTALHRRGSAGSFFGWDDERLAFDLRRDAVGVRQVRYGNGVVTRWQRTREGEPVRIVVTPPHAGPPLWDSSLASGTAATVVAGHRGLRLAQQALYDGERHRIADLDAKGRLTREYVWLADQLIAVIELDEPRIPHAAPRTVAERIGRAIAAAWRLLRGRGERIAYVHANPLGAPVLVTDGHARAVGSGNPVARLVADLAPGREGPPAPPGTPRIDRGAVGSHSDLEPPIPHDAP